MKNNFSMKLISFLLVFVAPTAVYADDYAYKNGWRFLNFNNCPTPPCTPPIDKTLSWAVYRDALIGIPPTEDAWSSAFDVLFYEQIFKSKLTADGNCFGMSLLNLMIQKNGGHMGYCAPVTQYSGDPNPDVGDPGFAPSRGSGPTDMMLRHVINVMHGHQVNLPTVQFFLDIFAKHFNRDGAYAFDQVNYWQSRGDLTLVSITPSWNPADGGHTLIAYKTDDHAGKKIFVLDPNRTWGNSTDQMWYNNESNFIQITNHAWSFDMGGSTWSGDPGTGGNIVITPISVTGPLSRSPASLGDSVIGQLLNTLVLTGDGATVEQVTDAQGKRLYKPGTMEIDVDPATGMTNMIPWFVSDQRSSNHQTGPVMLFQLGSSGGALRVSVSAGTGGYMLNSMSGRTAVSVTARGGTGTDVLTIRNPGTATSSVLLENQRGASEYDVTITRARVPHSQIRVLSASRLRINGAGAIEVGLTNAGEALQISSRQASLRYDLTLAQITRRARETLTRSEVSQDPGAARAVQPQDWQQLKRTQVVEQWRGAGPPLSSQKINQ
jgi:hypothetical protein